MEYLFAFVSLFPLYLTGIGGNLPDNVSSSFLFTKLLLVEIILTTCLAISCVGIFLHPQFSIGGNLCFVVLMSYQQPCFTINTGIFWVLGQACLASVIHLYNVLRDSNTRRYHSNNYLCCWLLSAINDTLSCLNLQHG